MRSSRLQADGQNATWSAFLPDSVCSDCNVRFKKSLFSVHGNDDALNGAVSAIPSSMPADTSNTKQHIEHDSDCSNSNGAKPPSAPLHTSCDEGKGDFSLNGNAKAAETPRCKTVLPIRVSHTIPPTRQVSPTKLENDKLGSFGSLAINNGQHPTLLRRNTVTPRRGINQTNVVNGAMHSTPSCNSSSPDSVTHLMGNATTASSGTPYCTPNHGRLYQSNGCKNTNYMSMLPGTAFLSPSRPRSSPTNVTNRSIYGRSSTMPLTKQMFSWFGTCRLRTVFLLTSACACIAYASLLWTMVLTPIKTTTPNSIHAVFDAALIGTNDVAAGVSEPDMYPSKRIKSPPSKPRVIQLLGGDNYRRISRREYGGGVRPHRQHLVMEFGVSPELFNISKITSTNENSLQEQNYSETATSFDQPESKDELVISKQLDDEVHEPSAAGLGNRRSKDICIPLADWQTKSFVNCNSIHEIDMVFGTSMSGVNINQGFRNQTTIQPMTTATQLDFLGQGWFRSTWKLQDTYDYNSLVLKTLRIEREFLDEYYDLHRRDAVAMERLTHSPFVMNVFGYCGQSAINELANFNDKTVNSLEALDRRFRGRAGPAIDFIKLRIATSIAIGVTHVHDVNLPRYADEEDAAVNDLDPRTYLPAMVHYDLNPRNIAIVKGGQPKLNDFNIAEFLKYNPATNKTCGFPSRLHEPWWRAPEEMNMNTSTTTFVNEKVDIYALGGILFHILTTHSPRGKMKRERMEEVRALVRKGVAPTLPESYRQSMKSNRATRAFVEAMDMCFVVDPDKRASARDVANILFEALEKVKEEQDQHKKGKSH